MNDAVVAVAVVAIPLFAVGFAVAYWRARDAQDASRAVAGVVGTVVVGAVSVLTGLAEGFAGAGVGALDVLAPHADLLAQIGIAWAGWSGLQGGLMSEARTFLVFVAALVAVSLVWGE